MNNKIGKYIVPVIEFHEKETGYDFLELIHLTLFKKNYSLNSNIKRYDKESKEYIIINTCINTLLELDFDDDINQIAYTIAQNISILHMYQPFCDGNSRTLFLFLNFILSKRCNISSWELLENNNERIPFFSIFYHNDDIPTEMNISYIKEKLSLIRKKF